MCDKSLTLFAGRCYGDDWHSVWLSAKRSWTEPFWVRMMSTTTPHALGERAQIILKTLIDRFIREGEPVGSRTIARESGLDLSPASIRNALLDLEEQGFLQSPHASAGRVPTVRGYRLFVDSLLTVQPLESAQLALLEQGFVADETVTRQQVIDTASRLLSGITRMAGVVTLPRREQLGLRHIEFLPLSGHQVLAVLVFEGQEVQNRILKVERPFSASELQQASNYLNTLFVGKGIQQVRDAIVDEMRRTRADMDELMRAAVELASVVFDAPDEADYVIAGQSNLMDFKELSHVEKLRALFDAFTAKREMLHLLDQALQGEGAQIFIGEESGYRVLDDCSVVTAPYRVNGQVVGVLAVIGPTRMAYQRVIPIVDITARLLGSALNLSN